MNCCDHYRFCCDFGTGRSCFVATTTAFAAILVLVGVVLLRPLPLLLRFWYWSRLVYCDHYRFCCDFGTGRVLFIATTTAFVGGLVLVGDYSLRHVFPFIWNPDCHIQKPSYIAARGCIVKVCMPSLFLEYWGKIAPILNLECPYVSDGISKPCRVFQCFYRSVKVCLLSLCKGLPYRFSR